MNPTLTSLIAEHFSTGLLAVTAVFLVLEPSVPLKTMRDALPSTFAVLVLSAVAYVAGVVLAHLSARLFEGTENDVYVAVLRDECGVTLGSGLLARLVEDQIAPSGDVLKLSPQEVERLFGRARYRVLANSSLKERLGYYQTMVRVCRNSALPLVLLGCALFYLAFRQPVFSAAPLLLALGCVGLAFGSYRAALGYTEWLGYATLRAFAALTPMHRAS